MEDEDSNDATEAVDIHAHFHPSEQQTPVPGTQPGVWTTGFCECSDDPCNTIITNCCGFVTFGQIAEILDRGQPTCCVSGMFFLLYPAMGMPTALKTWKYRTRLRRMYGLKASPAPDWVLHCCCQSCALCQEYRELKHRGLDPSLGWSNNLARLQRQQQQMAAKAPPAKQAMAA